MVGLGNGSTRQLIVGGFESRLDGSSQPYALVIPAGMSPGDSRPRRLDLWFHGRGEKLSEVNFLAGAQRSSGQYTPADTIVLHPYGRYSNAFKFAGEIDVLEALAYVQRRLPIDSARISTRGFSMGGAACWQFATHFADRFFAANPGAGFSETPEFLKSFQGEDLTATPMYQRKLWRWYDCPPWSRNLAHCPTVAYSGEIDRQKQAADVMEAALADHGIEMVHVIGPETAHKIHPLSKIEIERRLDSIAANVSPGVPLSIDLTTQTLRYNRMHWIAIQGLKEHWKSAHVQASLTTDHEQTVVDINTNNVTHLRLQFDAGQWPMAIPSQPIVRINQQEIAGSSIRSDRSWVFDVALVGGQWKVGSGDTTQLRKRPGLQGPIDDAFMAPFLFVTPSGKSRDQTLEDWVEAESGHAQTHWRKHFRGDVRAVADREVNNDQIDQNHLILFGDPDSNSIIAKIADSLPVSWSENTIQVGDRQYPRQSHAVIMVYPNPLNPNRYIVLNSGFTFREYDYLNNARQTPKLPDWAVVDISEGATTRDPGKIVSAGFFDENWRVQDQ